MIEDFTRTVALDWSGDLRFNGGPPGGPATLLDGDAVQAPGPVHMLLAAAAACSGADVVSILRKMQVDLREFRTEVTGQRRSEHPRRVTSLHFRFRLRGGGLDETKARRAIDLSIEKYCSVLGSLNPDIPITYELDLG